MIFIIVLFPTLALAEAGGSPFDTGFTALPTLVTGTVAKVASLIAIVVSGFAKEQEGYRFPKRTSSALKLGGLRGFGRRR